MKGIKSSDTNLKELDNSSGGDPSNKDRK